MEPKEVPTIAREDDGGEVRASPACSRLPGLVTCILGAVVLATTAAAIAEVGVDTLVTPRTGARCHGEAATVKGVKGSGGDDVIVGKSRAEKISGKGGDDVICAGGGNDTVKGGSGDDLLFGGSGKDRLDGGSGTDGCDGGSGKDKIKNCEGAGPPPPDDVAPTAIADAATVDEDVAATTIDVLANDTDPDGGPKTITSKTNGTHGNVQITNSGADLTYTPDPNYCGPDSFIYTLNGGSTTTVSITVTCLDDPPTAVNDSKTVAEDSSATTIDVLANDTDSDGGPKTITSKTNGTHGSVAITNSGADLTYTPDSNYCGPDSFTYTVNGGSTATVSITVTCANDFAPVANPDSFDAIGNTGLFVGTTRPASQAGKQINGSVLANDTDADTPPGGLIAEPVTDAPTTLGGTITIESDGNFTYHPDAVDTGVTDTFTYRVCDTSPCNAATVFNATGTLSLPIAGQVWYVRNNDAAGGDGTSDRPFDTIAEAEAADSVGDSVYVFDGDNTSVDLDTGYLMETNERLFGEHSGISLDPDGPGPLALQNLHPGTPGAFPTLTTTAAEDVVSLAAGTTIDGFNVDPGGLGGGIGGGPGAGGPAAGNVTIANVNIVDGGTLGTGAGVDLDGTTGTNSVSNLVIATGGAGPGVGAVGVRLVSAGTVNFASAGVISITTTGARGLDASNTNMGGGSTFDAITVTGSGSGGVSMSNTTGTTALGDGSGTDLSLTTTSGSSPALALASAGSVSIPGSGIADVRATGGPALDVTGTAGASLALDDVDSTGSADDGINISGLGTGTFTAASGDIGGAAGIAFDLDGGSGTVTYPGAITNGSGQTADITARTGGAVTLSGPISDSNDAGGGIMVTGNSGGSTTFSNASKVVNTTGGGDAVVMGSSDGHTLTFSGGGLGIDTTSGKGLDATNSGTLAVSGAGNTITTTTGTALNISNTDVGGGGAGSSFQSIASNGASSGIVLNNTGAGASLNVTGNGGSCTSAATCTGGAIQSSTGPGISLTSVGGGASLTRMSINNNGDDGIRATTVGSGINLSDSRVASNGNAVFERGLDYTNVTGSSSIAASTITGSAETNARISNDVSGTDTLSVTGSTFSSNSTALGAHGVEIRGDGTAAINATVTGSTFSANRDNAFVLGNGGGSPTMNLHFNNNTVTGGNASMLSGQPGIVVAPTGGAQTKVEINNNQVSGIIGRSVIVNPLPGSTSAAQFDATVNNNTIGNATPFSGSAQGEGMVARGAGDGDSRFAIRNNLIRSYAQIGLWLRSQEGSGGTGNADYTVTGNTISDPSGSGFEGIFVSSGAASLDNMIVCADIGGAGALANTFDAAGTGGIDDIAFSKRFSTDLRLPGYTSGGNLLAYVQGRNTGAPTVANYDNPLTGTPSACALPTLPP